MINYWTQAIFKTTIDDTNDDDEDEDKKSRFSFYNTFVCKLQKTLH